MKQLSRGLHAINRALNFFNFLGGNATHLKTKQKRKQENSKVLILYPKQLVLLLFSRRCFVVVGVFLFFHGPPGTAGLLTQHVCLAFGCGSTQTRTAVSTSA